MKKTTLVILATLGLGTASLLAFGGPGHKCGAFGERGGMFKIMKQLDLSAEQKKKMKILREERKSYMKAKFKKMKEMKSSIKSSMMSDMKPDLNTFMTTDSFDKEAFKAQLEKKLASKREMMESKKSEMLEKRAEGMKKVFDILTPEQRSKWIELSKEK